MGVMYVLTNKIILQSYLSSIHFPLLKIIKKCKALFFSKFALLRKKHGTNQVNRCYKWYVVLYKSAKPHNMTSLN